MKRRWSRQHRAAAPASRRGEQIVVGVNKWTETEPSPLTPAKARSWSSIPAVEAQQVEQSQGWRAERDDKAVQERARRSGARRQGRPQHHGAVDRLRQGRRHHGRMGRHAAQGVRRVPRADRRIQAAVRRSRRAGSRTCASRSRRASAKLGRRIKFLVGKPGLDGHSNGAEQIAVRARDCGMEVVYEGIRLTPAQIVRAALDEGVHVRGAVDPVGQPRAAGARGRGAHAQGRARRRAGRRRRHHPARGRSSLEGVRRRGRLYAEGLPAQRHHGRHREAGVGRDRWPPEQTGARGKEKHARGNEAEARAAIWRSEPRRSASALASRP